MATRISADTIVEDLGGEEDDSERPKAALGGFSSPPPPGFGKSWTTSPSVPADGTRQRDVGDEAEPVRPRARAVDATLVDGFTGPLEAASGEVKRGDAFSGSRRAISGWLLSEDRRRSYTLRSGSNLVGRTYDNDVVVEDASVSGLQCNVICEETETLLMPRPEARNPSEVNGQRVYQTTVIPAYATVRFGHTVWTFVPALPLVARTDG